MNARSSSRLTFSMKLVSAYCARFLISTPTLSCVSASLCFIFCSSLFFRSCWIYCTNFAWWLDRRSSSISEVTSPTSSEVHGSFTYWSTGVSLIRFLCSGDKPEGSPLSLSFFWITPVSPSKLCSPALFLSFCLANSKALYRFF